MNVFNYVYGFSTRKGIVGIVRADNKTDAIDRIEDKYSDDEVCDLVLMSGYDNDYGVIGFNEFVTEPGWYAVDLRSRKDGDSQKTIWCGKSYDDAWEVRNQWFDENMPYWSDQDDVNDLIDGSDGLFAYVMELGIGEKKYV